MNAVISVLTTATWISQSASYAEGYRVSPYLAASQEQSHSPRYKDLHNPLCQRSMPESKHSPTAVCCFLSGSPQYPHTVLTIPPHSPHSDARIKEFTAHELQLLKITSFTAMNDNSSVLAVVTVLESPQVAHSSVHYELESQPKQQI